MCSCQDTDPEGKAVSVVKRKVQRQRAAKNPIPFPVVITKGSHLFPSRTQKLSPSVPKVLGWTRPGSIGRRRNLLFLSSSMAEHSAVNRRVVGSSPTWGAHVNRWKHSLPAVFSCFRLSNLWPAVTHPDFANLRKPLWRKGRRGRPVAQNGTRAFVHITMHKDE